MDEPDYTAEATFFILMRPRANGAKDTSPATVFCVKSGGGRLDCLSKQCEPGAHSGRRFKRIQRPRALPWATIQRRFQRRHSRCAAAQQQLIRIKRLGWFAGIDAPLSLDPFAIGCIVSGRWAWQ
jgi:hypothetical protein